MIEIFFNSDNSFPWSTVLPSSISALAALISTIFLIINNIAHSKAKKQIQARKISAWPAKINNTSKIIINNVSSSPIYDVIVVTASINKSSIPQDGSKVIKLVDNDRCHNSEITYYVFHQLPPGTFAKDKRGDFHLSMQVELGIEIAFTDVFEKHWLINTQGQLKKIRKNYLEKRYGLPTPLDWDQLDYVKDKI